MDRKDLDRYYADNVGLIHTVTRKGIGRLQAIGAATDYDELFQDMVEVFIKSYDLFDEAVGFQFSSYFMRSAYNKLNRIVEKFEIERIDNGVRSVEEMTTWLGDGEDADFAERIASEGATPEELVIAKQMAEQMLNGLSPVASMLAQMAMDPPDFIEREFLAAQAHAEYARELGVERRARGSLNLSFVCLVLEKTTDLPAGTIRSAKAEVVSFAKRSM